MYDVIICLMFFAMNKLTRITMSSRENMNIYVLYLIWYNVVIENGPLFFQLNYNI